MLQSLINLSSNCLSVVWHRFLTTYSTMFWVLKTHTHTHHYILALNSSVAGPLSNLHAANTSPLILLSYYLLKSIFHLCYSRPSGAGEPLGHLPWLLHDRSALSSAALKPGSYSFLSMAILLLPWPTNPEVLPLSFCPAIGHQQLYLPIRTS